MPLRLDATIELTDDQLAQIARHLADAGRASAASPDPRSELPRGWRLVDEQHGVTYSWPQGEDVYEPFRIYEGDNPAGSIRLAIGRCERVIVRDQNRRYFITGHVAESGAFRPIAEFLATDDNETSGETIAVIKGKGGSARMYDPGDELPPDYSAFKTQTYRERIDKPNSYSKLGIVAGEEDVDAMLGHTFIQAASRLGILPG